MLVDPLGHGAVGAGEFVHRDFHVDVAGVMFLGHMQHFRDETLDVGAQTFNVVVNKDFLPGEFLQFGLEVALAELGDAGHGLFLDADVAHHHAVDALGHGAVGAGEFVRRDFHVNVAGVVFLGHVAHFEDEGVQGVDAADSGCS